MTKFSKIDNPKMIIRKALRKDLKEIAHLFREEFSRKPYYENWTESNAYKKILDYFKKADILIAVVDSQVVGFIISSIFLWSRYKKGKISEIVVAKNFQGKGIGSRLVKEVEKKHSKRGAKYINLTAHKSAKALSFYKNRGYKMSDLVLMEKKL